MTALLLWTFVLTVLTVLNVLRDLVPAAALFQSFTCVCPLQRGCVLLRVPSGAVVVIPAKLFSHERLWRGDPSGRRFCGDLPGREGFRLAAAFQRCKVAFVATLASSPISISQRSDARARSFSRNLRP
jgi:hypothetical protein